MKYIGFILLAVIIAIILLLLIAVIRTLLMPGKTSSYVAEEPEEESLALAQKLSKMIQYDTTSHANVAEVEKFLFSFSTPITLSNATRIAPRFALPQSYPPFAYRKAYASLLCSYRGRSSRQKITLVQAHRNFCLVTLLALKKSPQRTLCSSRRRALSRVTTSLRLRFATQTSSGP